MTIATFGGGMPDDGHFCDIPAESRRTRDGKMWHCECGQNWIYRDRHWRMCAPS